MPAGRGEEDDARIRRRTLPNMTLEAHPEDMAVVVKYVVETAYLDASGRILETEQKHERKRIKLAKMLKPSTNAVKLAGDVMRKTNCIHESRREDLEKAIQELQHVMIRDELRASTAAEGGAYWLNGGAADADEAATPEDPDGEADMSRLEEYVELLYEGRDKDDMTQKVRGTGRIVQLFCDVHNLEPLIQDTTLMGALTRVLGEEFKKSVPLCYNIMRCFLALSNFQEMHPILGNYRVGSLSLKIVELEVQRARHREEERRKRQAEQDRAITALQDAGKERDAAALRREAEKEAKQHTLQCRQQDKVLFVSVHVLLNLAEDVGAERKMVKRDLVVLLTALLERTSANLLYLVVTFLKKLSVHCENKDAIRDDTAAVSRLMRLVPCSCEPLTVAALRLLHNLSFDAGIREQMVKAGALPRLVELLKKAPHRARVLRLLYHLSLEDRCKSMFAYTEAVPIVSQLVLNFPRPVLAAELAALAVNLSLNPRNAEAMASQRGLQHLVEKVVTTKDPLLMKVVRNLSHWTYALQADMEQPERDYRHRGGALWGPCLEPLLELATETDNHDLLVEALGALANLTPLDLPRGVTWALVLQNYGLAPLIARLLVPGMAQADVVLEAVALAGACATDPGAAKLLAGTAVPGALHDALRDTAGDAEVILQALYAVWRLLQHEPSREELLYGAKAVPAMLACLESRVPAVRRQASAALALVLEFDRNDDGTVGTLGAQVRRYRFRVYNKEWLQYADQAEIGDSKDDGQPPPYGHSDEEEEDEVGDGEMLSDSDADLLRGHGAGGHMDLQRVMDLQQGGGGGYDWDGPWR